MKFNLSETFHLSLNTSLITMEKNFFSESLAGRKYIFELFPLSFREFLALKNPNLLLPKTDEKVSEAIFEEINRYYDEYLLYGGFRGSYEKNQLWEKKR